MKKGIRRAAFLLSAFLLTGCAMGKDYATLNKGDEMDKAVYEFQKLMDSDKSGDKKAVFWNGEKAYTDSDELDDNKIDDGRSFRGFEPLDKELFSLNIYGMEERETILDTDKHVIYAGIDGDWRFEIEQVDGYDSALERLKQEKWLHKLYEDDPSKSEKTAIFRGVRNYDGKNYAGYVVCYNDGFGQSYEYSYMCMGNMNDAGVMINQLRGQFRLNIDFDKWREENLIFEEDNGNG
ncbi:MAG: hypothetical protein K6G10_09900 [Butyrivibrio sp.]|nr:hypothetical protein [Butyrivibrio sp.]